MKKVIIPDISFTALDGNNRPQVVSAAQQLFQIAAAPSGAAEFMPIGELRERLSLVDKLIATVEKEATEVLLEDSEHTILLGVVLASTWRGVGHSADDLVKAVEQAETVEVAET